MWVSMNPFMENRASSSYGQGYEQALKICQLQTVLEKKKRWEEVRVCLYVNTENKSLIGHMC